jgi:hypothetical protein
VVRDESRRADPRIEVRVAGVVGNSMGLVLEPPSLQLSTPVLTSQTLSVPFKLHNTSITAHSFAFTTLPQVTNSIVKIKKTTVKYLK